MDKQKKKYKQAYQNNTIVNSMYAYYIDKIRLFHNKRQLFGTLIGSSPLDTSKVIIVKIQNFKKINKRRSDFGFFETFEERCNKHQISTDYNTLKKSGVFIRPRKANRLVAKYSNNIL